VLLLDTVFEKVEALILITIFFKYYLLLCPNYYVDFSPFDFKLRVV
jgi:hypothetical protein